MECTLLITKGDLSSEQSQSKIHGLQLISFNDKCHINASLHLNCGWFIEKNKAKISLPKVKNSRKRWKRSNWFCYLWFQNFTYWLVFYLSIQWNLILHGFSSIQINNWFWQTWTCREEQWNALKNSCIYRSWLKKYQKSTKNLSIWLGPSQISNGTVHILRCWWLSKYQRQLSQTLNCMEHDESRYPIYPIMGLSTSNIFQVFKSATNLTRFNHD